MIALNLDTAAELGEAIYYAQATAGQIRLESPSAAPGIPEWEELSPSSRALWITTAERLIALVQQHEGELVDDQLVEDQIATWFCHRCETMLLLDDAKRGRCTRSPRDPECPRAEPRLPMQHHEDF